MYRLRLTTDKRIYHGKELEAIGNQNHICDNMDFYSRSFYFDIT